MTRPLCPYPQVAKYKGTGSTDDAANFVCAAMTLTWVRLEADQLKPDYS